MIATAQPAFSETVSEKPKRGRPKGIASRLVDRFIATSPIAWNVKTLRGRHNLAFQQRALEVLGSCEDERFFWVTGRWDEVAAGRGTMRRTILQHLGRIEDPDDMREAALEICRLRPTASEVGRIIREYRNVRQVKQSDALELANAMISLVNQYVVAHTGTTHDQVQAALRTVMHGVATRQPAMEGLADD